MAREPSGARRRAGELGADPGAVVGPLHGYHHETYVIPLPVGPGRDGGERWKCREPRSGLLWSDRRCFLSEEQLLGALQGRISGIPDLIRVGDVVLQRFIEGHTLKSPRRWSGRALPQSIVDQIVDLFREMAHVAPNSLHAARRCCGEDRAADGDTDGFLERLIHFAEEHVYRANLPRFGALFEDLGIDDVSFKNLREHVAGLTPRPFCLLHADLHRENFVLDPEGRLWTIDWELAMFGDPLYDLATHLYLMRYPKWQEDGLVRRWCATVEEVRPGSSHGRRQDLPRLLDFKRAQSVFTDVIRQSLSLVDQDRHDIHALGRAALKVHDVLRAAAPPLGLNQPPGTKDIVAALGAWREQQPDERS
jgi:hypothetical protein